MITTIIIGTAIAIIIAATCQETCDPEGAAEDRMMAYHDEQDRRMYAAMRSGDDAEAKRVLQEDRARVAAKFPNDTNLLKLLDGNPLLKDEDDVE